MTDNTDDKRLLEALRRLDEAVKAIELADNPDTLMMYELLEAAGQAVQVQVETAQMATLDIRKTNAMMVASHNEFVDWFGKLKQAFEEGQQP